MYASFFGFRELPFNNTPDPRFFYSTPDHEEALASLVYAVKERKGFVLLTGEVGAGKTLVTRMMVRHFGTRIVFANINHVVQSPEDLMEAICTEFDLPIAPNASATQLVRMLHDFLLTQFGQDTPVVLVLDEAQNLPVEGFEQLRTIGNLEADDAKLLQIAIVGQPELQRKFVSPELRQLQQRIFRSFHLGALDAKAAQGYIRHRLSVVRDGETEIFTPDAIAAIVEVSRGVPRIINTVCDNALLSAYSADRRIIDGPFVRSVVTQMMPAAAPGGLSENVPENADTHRVSLPREVRPPTGQDLGVRTSIGESATRVERESVAQRAAAIAARPVDPQHAGAGAPRQVFPVDGTHHETLTAVQEQALLTREVARRVEALERRLCGLPTDLAEARAVHASLGPMVEQARATTAKAEAATGEMNRRHDQLRTVADTVKNVIRDLRRLLERADDAVARTDQAQRHARSIHARLVVQSQRSSRLVTDLANVMQTSASQNRQAFLPNRLDAQLRIDRGDGSSRPISACTNGTDGVLQVLEGTRESVSALRSLTDGSRKGFLQPNGRSDTLATDRLVSEVENLAKSVEPAAAASPGA